MFDKGDCEPVARALVVLAEDTGEDGAGTPWRVEIKNEEGKVVFRVDLIGWIGIIGGTHTIPGTEN